MIRVFCCRGGGLLGFFLVLLLCFKEILSCLTEHMSLSCLFLIQINNLVCTLKTVHSSCAKRQYFSLLLMIQDPGPVRVRKRNSLQPTQGAITYQHKRSHLPFPADKKSVCSSAPPRYTQRKLSDTLRWICSFLAPGSAQAAAMFFSGPCRKGKLLFSLQAQGSAPRSCTRKAPQACTEVESSAKLLGLLLNIRFPVKAEFQ